MGKVLKLLKNAVARTFFHARAIYHVTPALNWNRFLGDERRGLNSLNSDTGCLFVCLYPINAKTAEAIGPEFCVGHHVIPGKVYE